MDVIEKQSKFLQQVISSPQSGLEPTAFGFMQNALRHFPDDSNTGSGNIDIFASKVHV